MLFLLHQSIKKNLLIYIKSCIILEIFLELSSYRFSKMHRIFSLLKEYWRGLQYWGQYVQGLKSLLNLLFAWVEVSCQVFHSNAALTHLDSSKTCVLDKLVFCYTCRHWDKWVPWSKWWLLARCSIKCHRLQSIFLVRSLFILFSLYFECRCDNCRSDIWLFVFKGHISRQNLWVPNNERGSVSRRWLCFLQRYLLIRLMIFGAELMANTIKHFDLVTS